MIDTTNELFGMVSTTPEAYLSVNAPRGATYETVLIATTTASGAYASSTAFMIDTMGRVTIGSATATRLQLTVDGGATTVERPLDAASTVTVDWNLGNQYRITMTAATTFVFRAPALGFTGRLNVCQDATGGRTAVWPASTTIQWSGSDVPPSLTTRPGHCDVISVEYTYATGTAIYFMVRNGRF